MAYVQQVLAPTLSGGHIVVVDNIGSHKVEGVCEAIAAAGAHQLLLARLQPRRIPTAAAGLPTNSAIGFRPVTDADFQLVFDLLGFDGTLGDTFCANDAIEPKMSVGAPLPTGGLHAVLPGLVRGQPAAASGEGRQRPNGHRGACGYHRGNWLE